jgi:hypothetical protein
MIRRLVEAVKMSIKRWRERSKSWTASQEVGGPLIVICFGARGSDFCQDHLSIIRLLMHLVPIARAKDL